MNKNILLFHYIKKKISKTEKNPFLKLRKIKIKKILE
jgi:hypothetical protein